MEKVFGLKAAWKNYGWKSFRTDSVLPIIISSMLVFCVHRTNGDMCLQLRHLVEVALVLTAYALILTFVVSGGFSLVKKTAKGKELIKKLNSSFAICLIISTVSIMVMIVVSCIATMDVKIQNPNVINYPMFLIICYLLVFSVSILIGVVIDVFNCGQTTLLDDNNV